MRFVRHNKGMQTLDLEPSSLAREIRRRTLTTIHRYLPKMADNITTGPQLMNWAKQHKLIEMR